MMAVLQGAISLLGTVPQKYYGQLHINFVTTANRSSSLQTRPMPQAVHKFKELPALAPGRTGL